MADATIRRAGEQNIAVLGRLYNEFHEFHVAGVPDRLRSAEGDAAADPTLAEALRKIFADPDAAIFVAEVSGEAVGLAEVYVREEAAHPLTVAHHYGYLQSLVVAAPFRRSGLGARLTAAAEAWATGKGATEMQLDSWEFAAGPVPFYEGQGYRTLKRKMVKSLRPASGKEE